MNACPKYSSDPLHFRLIIEFRRDSFGLSFLILTEKETC